MRVYELAKEFGIPSKLLIARMRALGIEVSGHMAGLTEEQERRLRSKFAPREKPRSTKVNAAKVTKGGKKPRVRVRHRPKEEPAEEERETTASAEAAEDESKIRGVEPAADEAEDRPKKTAASEKTVKSEDAAKGSVTDTVGSAADEVKVAPKKVEPPSRPTKPVGRPKVRPKAAVKPGKPERDIKRPVFDDKGGKKDKKEKKVGKKGPRILYRPEKPLTAEELGLDKDKQRRSAEESRRARRKRRRRRRKSGSAQIHELRTARKKRSKEKTAKQLTIDRALTPVELADKLSVTSDEILQRLEALGEEYSVVEEMDIETTAALVEEFDYTAVLPDDYDDESKLQSRPPIVAVLGHVDHGKTTLLDYIRQTKVAAGEAGGITQHIGAYQVETAEGKLTFIDTPGHEAFTAMRARGAEVTDIVVLVVAADDGVMPQTVEAVNHARAAGVEIVVAVTKIDKDNADPERVRRQLSKYNVQPEQWGGENTFCDVSGISGEGVDHLLEILALHGEMLELQADPDASPQAVVIESRIDRGRGTVATVVVTDGTLKPKMAFVCGTEAGKVRILSNEQGKRLKAVGPGSPAEVQGFDGIPEAGDTLVVVADEKEARSIAQLRQNAAREEKLQTRQRQSLADFLAPGGGEEKKKLKLVVKADVAGTVEAVVDSLGRFESDEVELEVIHSAVGAITEADVQLAAASEAVVVGFSVRPDSKAQKLAQEINVEIKNFRIIYELLDEVRELLSGLLSPEIREEDHGKAEVRQTFRVPKVGVIAGCYITAGRINRKDHARLVRDGRVVWEGRLESLRRFKDDVREVAEGYECGIGLQRFDDIHIGDVIETYTLVEEAREFKA
ncbi:MAG: translation initiation factor IF-2 [Candidatus Coatesbacteria bacterium]|nr:translation initiation factor IF-2 [Candidatus Coatesbacteria bacterium]